MKKINSTLNKSILVLAGLLSTSAMADVHLENEHCDVDLNYDLTISPQHVLIIDQDETLIDIYNDKTLFIKGEQISLNSNQQELITNYSTSLRQTIPQAGEIAIEAVNLAFEGIEAALGGHVDLSNSRAKFDEIEEKVSEKFNDQNGHYSFKQGEFTFDTDDEQLDNMIEESIEDIMPELIGGLISNIGQAISNGEGLESLDNLGENIEREVEAKAEQIEAKAGEFCQSLVAINNIEQDLFESNNQFIYFDLLNVDAKNTDSE